MSSSAMADRPTSSNRTQRPDTLSRLAGHDTLWVECWVDPVVDQLGHDPRSDYVEIFWLPILGPSCTLAARRMASWLELEPGGYELPLGPFARSLGLGEAAGRHAPVNRTLARLIDFGMASLGGGTFALRRSFPPLAARHLSRLPAHLVDDHAAHVTEARTARTSGASR